jgi:3-oxoacyl-(acyl-carrier-protein) synthase
MDFYIRNTSSISPQATFETDEFLSEKTERDTSLEYISALEPDYKKYITDAGLRRRMSRVVKMGVASALDCVKTAGIDNPDAIITATGLGCLADTEKFLANVIENEERLLNPTSFIQSTFNTIGAQIALILKNHNYNFTYVHRGFSFESAIVDAMMQLEDGEAQQVLVGAVDEITPTSADIMKRMGFCSGEAKLGEGSQFFMLSSQPSDNNYAKLKDVHTFLTTEEIKADDEINTFLSLNNLAANDVDLVIMGNVGDPKQDHFLHEARKSVFEDIPAVSFKQLCGEYQTASSFALWCAANILYRQQLPEILQPEKKISDIKRIVIYNIYRNTNHSLFLLEKA